MQKFVVTLTLLVAVFAGVRALSGNEQVPEAPAAPVFSGAR